MHDYLLRGYPHDPGIWDEMFDHPDIRTSYKSFFQAIQGIPAGEMNLKHELARKLFMSQGVTFTVYNSGEGIEKIFPFDIIPRILQARNGQSSKPEFANG